jgi:hypothetical protein
MFFSPVHSPSQADITSPHRSHSPAPSWIHPARAQNCVLQPLSQFCSPCSSDQCGGNLGGATGAADVESEDQDVEASLVSGLFAGVELSTLRDVLTKGCASNGKRSPEAHCCVFDIWYGIQQWVQVQLFPLCFAIFCYIVTRTSYTYVYTYLLLLQLSNGERN